MHDTVIHGLLLQIGSLEHDLGDPARAPYAARCIGTAAAFVADLSARRAEAAVLEAQALAEALRADRAALRREVRRMRILNAALVTLIVILAWVAGAP